MRIKLEYILIIIIVLIGLHLLMDNCNCEGFVVGVGFFVGIKDLNNIFPNEKYPDKITDEPFGEGIPREFYKQGLRLGPRTSRSSKPSESELKERLHSLLTIAKESGWAAEEVGSFMNLLNDSTRKPTWLEDEVGTWERVLIDAELIHSSSNLSYKLYDVGWYYANDTGRIFISAITSPRKVPIAEYIDYNMYKHKKELKINGKKYHIGTPGKEVKGEYRLDIQDNALFIVDLYDNKVVDEPLDLLSPPPDM